MEPTSDHVVFNRMHRYANVIYGSTWADPGHPAEGEYVRSGWKYVILNVNRTTESVTAYSFFAMTKAES